jgi:hypothetical protein
LRSTGARPRREFSGRIRVSMSSERPGDAVKEACPLRLRTYATSCHTWYCGIRPEKDGMPFGRPRTMLMYTLSGEEP